MPLLILLLLIVLIAQIGFWDTLSAVLGAAAMVVLLLLLAMGALALAAWWAFRRVRGRFRL